MSRAQPILSGGLYFITRRTHSRRFRLRPDPHVNQLIEYCVAVAARKYDVGVVAFDAMSTHWHAIILDRHGNHRAFVQWVDAMIARALNHRQGGRDAFWSGRRNAPVLLADRDAFLRKLVYLITNPVSSGLVARAAQWPGFITLPGDLVGLRPPVARPRGFFRTDGNLPATATLRLVNPRAFGLDRMPARELRTLVGDLVETRERELAQERREKGSRVLGRVKVLSRDPFATPTGREHHERKRIVPRVATRCAALRVAILQWMANFVDAHREAFSRLRAGKQKPVFPFGTDRMRRLFGMECEPRPPDFPVPLLT